MPEAFPEVAVILSILESTCGDDVIHDTSFGLVPNYGDIINRVGSL